MKRYFAVAFVLLVALLLILRKQTEPEKFTAVQMPAESAAGATPDPAAATPTATPSSPVDPASTTGAGAAFAASTMTPEKLEQVRSQAKSAMASGYTAQRALQAEWDRFSSDLMATGWEPSSPELNYKLGFLSAFDAPAVEGFKENPERFSTDALVNREATELLQKFHYTPAAAKIRLADYARYCERGCVASKDWFEMLIVMPLDEQGNVDVWTINDKKEMKQVVDGTAGK